MAKESIKTKLDELVTHSTELGDTAFKLVSINAYRKTANVSASLFVTITATIIITAATLFCSVALALWLGDIFHSLAIGFLITGGFYILLYLIFLMLKKKFILPFFRNRMVKKIYE